MLVLLLCECYKIADVTSVRKVSAYCEELVSRGLMGRDEAARAALVATLLPTLDPARPPVAVEELGDAVQLDPAGLVRQIKVLGERGIKVGRESAAGHRLLHPLDDLLLPEAVLPLLLGRDDVATPPSVGIPYRYLADCASTNRWLKSEAAGSPSGTMAVTDDQTEGRGRLGRTWISEPGRDLTFSVLLKPPDLPAEVSLLSLAAGAAVAEVLEAIPKLAGRVGIKWPNDVLIDDKKVCGILLESSSRGEGLEWVVVGIGLNVNSDPCSTLERLEGFEGEGRRSGPLPTSISLESGSRVPRGPLLAALSARLASRWSGVEGGDTLDQIRARDILRGRQVRVTAGPPTGRLVAAGEAVGIDHDGALLVRGQRGDTAAVVAGEVTLSVDSPAT
jgi:BirA family biotin operon repressor/biotin-[acetyl-CoA-carboxylase] ligase